jgi:hypothetical protein
MMSSDRRLHQPRLIEEILGESPRFYLRGKVAMKRRLRCHAAAQASSFADKVPPMLR